MKRLAYIGGIVGILLVVALSLRTDFGAIRRAFQAAGLGLAWLIPYRLLFYLLYAVGWRVILRPSDPQGRASLRYLLGVTVVRDAVDRLLPVASVGGSLVGIRLVQWRGLPTAPVAASVVIEILITLVVVYVFTAMGLALLAQLGAGGEEYRRALLVFLLSLPVPIITVSLLRSRRFAEIIPEKLGLLFGTGSLAGKTAAVSQEVRAALHRPAPLGSASALQLLAFVSGAFEVWLALRLFGAPVSLAVALMLESMTQASRHLAFFVPAGIGVQEVGLVAFGHLAGVGAELAFAVAMVKRARELAWGIPALLAWQWAELRRSRSTSN
ncbi:MAG TPA: lysylphosphatidylglycerol synthase domain-containing protein [Steroidobacteraceae bacterium]|jgi:putative membrane protein